MNMYNMDLSYDFGYLWRINWFNVWHVLNVMGLRYMI